MLRATLADDGATMAEYALLVACIAVVVIGALQLLGSRGAGDCEVAVGLVQRVGRVDDDLAGQPFR